MGRLLVCEATGHAEALKKCQNQEWPSNEVSESPFSARTSGLIAQSAIKLASYILHSNVAHEEIRCRGEIGLLHAKSNDFAFSER